MATGSVQFQHDKIKSTKKCFAGFSVDELDGLHVSLTKTPSNTFGMNWNDLESLSLNITNALTAEWREIPAAVFKNLVERKRVPIFTFVKIHKYLGA